MKIHCDTIIQVPLADIKLNPNNRNTHTPEQIDRLVELIKYHGYRNPGVISNRSGLLAAGEGRYLATQRLGHTHMPCMYQDFDSDEAEYAFGVSDNAIASWATLNIEAIKQDVVKLPDTFNVDWLGVRDFKIEFPKPDDPPPDDNTLSSEGDVPHEQIKIPEIMEGDCMKVLPTLPADSVDAVVTDPPAGISFMGKEWDDDKGGRDKWIAWLTEVMRECYRVMKPGAHAFVWAIPRTSHWTGMALESAGFEVRDCVSHVFGSGFPKSLDVSKAIDRAAGVEREDRLIDSRGTGNARQGDDIETRGTQSTFGHGGVRDISTPVTPAAKQWAGFGTALKPAVETWWLVRKPIAEDTVAANVLKHGTGALNIDGTRIEAQDAHALARDNGGKEVLSWGGTYGAGKNSAQKRIDEGLPPLGRFPSNLLLSHNHDCIPGTCTDSCAVAILDEQSGVSKTPEKVTRGFNEFMGPSGSKNGGAMKDVPCYGDTGGASRFFRTFYCPKPARSERNEGLEGMPEKRHGSFDGNADHVGTRKIGASPDKPVAPQSNGHPTVKPIRLMKYLIRMITPPNGLVLDPFCGSGTTGVAAAKLGMRFMGIEQNPEYVQIASYRFKHELTQTEELPSLEDEELA